MTQDPSEPVSLHLCGPAWCKQNLRANGLAIHFRLAVTNWRVSTLTYWLAHTGNGRKEQSLLKRRPIFTGHQHSRIALPLGEDRSVRCNAVVYPAVKVCAGFGGGKRIYFFTGRLSVRPSQRPPFNFLAVWRGKTAITCSKAVRIGCQKIQSDATWHLQIGRLTSFSLPVAGIRAFVSLPPCDCLIKTVCSQSYLNFLRGLRRYIATLHALIHWLLLAETQLFALHLASIVWQAIFV